MSIGLFAFVEGLFLDLLVVVVGIPFRVSVPKLIDELIGHLGQGFEAANVRCQEIDAKV